MRGSEGVLGVTGAEDTGDQIGRETRGGTSVGTFAVDPFGGLAYTNVGRGVMKWDGGVGARNAYEQQRGWKSQADRLKWI